MQNTDFKARKLEIRQMDRQAAFRRTKKFSLCTNILLAFT